MLWYCIVLQYLLPRGSAAAAKSCHLSDGIFAVGFMAAAKIRHFITLLDLLSCQSVHPCDDICHQEGVHINVPWQRSETCAMLTTEAVRLLLVGS